MNLPNLLTIGRLFAVPVIIALIAGGEYRAAFWLFAIAAATDAVDGAIARRFDQRTTLGSYLDPVADKALLVSLYVTLAILGETPLWLAIAVVFRDIVIVGAVILAWGVQQPLPIMPLKISKANTLVQLLFAGLVLGVNGFSLDLGAVEAAGAYLVGALTLVSAAAYLAAFIRHMARTGQGRPDA